MATFSYTPTASGDDADQAADTTVQLTRVTVPLLASTQWGGFRIDATSIVDDLQGATINSAYINYYANTEADQSPAIDWYGEDVDTPAAFATTNNNISSRTLTTAVVNDTATNIGLTERSVEITSIIAEVTERTGFSGVIHLIADGLGGSDIRIVTWDNSSTEKRWSVDIDYTPYVAPSDATIELDTLTVAGSAVTASNYISDTLTVYVTAGNDDAHENTSNVGVLGASAIVLASSGGAGNVGGVIFRDVGIGPDAAILSALLEIYTVSTSYDSPDFVIKGEIDPADFAATTNSLSGRTPTTAGVAWAASNIGQDAYKTSPDISAVIQEIVNDADWSYGDDLALLLYHEDDAATFWFSSYENGNAARLVVVYEVTGGPQTIVADTLTGAASAVVSAVAPGAVSQLMDTHTSAGSVIDLVVTPGTVSLVMDTHDGTATVIDLVVTPGAVSQTMDTHTAASLAVTLSIVPGAVSLPMDVLSAAGIVENVDVVSLLGVLLNTLTGAGVVDDLVVVPGNVSTLMDDLVLSGIVESLTIGKGTASVALDTIFSTASVITLTVGNDQAIITLNTLTATGQTVVAMITGDNLPVELLTLAAAGSAVSIEVLPGAVVLTFNTFAALAQVMDLAVVWALGLNTISAVLSAEDASIAVGDVALLMAALGHYLTVPDALVLPGEMVIEPATLTAVTEAVILIATHVGADIDIMLAALTGVLQPAIAEIAPGGVVTDLQTLAPSLSLNDLLVFLLLGCALAGDRAAYGASSRDYARYSAVVSDRDGCR